MHYATFLLLSALLPSTLLAASLKPVAVTASSELTKYPGHLAKYAADGNCNDFQDNQNRYWSSDFINHPRGPHFLEFDFGKPVQFDRIQLFMLERYNLTGMLKAFRLEYFDGKNWQLIGNYQNDFSPLLDIVSGKKTKDIYTAKIPETEPLFRFPAVTGSKVRLTVADTHARLREMIVSMGESAPENTAKINAADPVKKWQFAPNDAALRPGYRNAGTTLFDSADGILFCDRRISGTGRRAFAVSTQQNRTLKIAVPPGIYCVFALSGDAIAKSPGCTLEIDGRSYRVAGTEKGNFAWESFFVENRTGTLEVALKAPWLLNTLIVAPLAERRAFDSAVAELMYNFDLQNNKITCEPPPTRIQKPIVGDADRKQGYLPFVSSIQQRIFRETTPDAKQCAAPLQAAVTSGGIKAASIAFYALDNLQDLELRMSDLKSGSNTLPADTVEIRAVKHHPQRVRQKGNDRYWAFIPELLETPDREFVPRENSQQYYLLFHAPSAAAPGVYRGRLKVTARNCPVREIPVTLEVYPFQLAELPEEQTFGMYHGDRDMRGVFPFRTSRKDALAQLNDMRIHNMNTVVFTPPKVTAENIESTLKYLNEMLDAAGFPKRPVPFFCGDIAPELIAGLRDCVKKNHYRELLIYIVDEPFNRRLTQAVKGYRRAKSVPGIRTYSTVTQNDVDAIGENLDVRCYTMTGYSRFDADQIRNYCRKNGKTFWWYSNAAREIPDAVRFKAGFFHDKTGATGQTYWAYYNPRGDVFNDFDERNNDHVAIYRKDGKIISTLQWEAIREGLDDLKYLHTLRHALRQNGAGNPAAAREAQALLERINADTEIRLAAYKKRFGAEIDLHIASFWSPEKYDEYRTALGAAIKKLTVQKK